MKNTSFKIHYYPYLDNDIIYQLNYGSRVYFMNYYYPHLDGNIICYWKLKCVNPKPISIKYDNEVIEYLSKIKL